MFENVGSKIKSLATVICYLGIAASVLWGGIYALEVADSWWADIIDYLPAVLIIVIGSILSWAGSLTLYGFGELVEKADKLS